MLKNKTLNFKLMLISAVSITLILSSMIFLLMDFKKSMMDSREKQIASLVDSVYSVIGEIDKDRKNGEITLPEAKARAKDIIEGIKYNGNEYFFIIDNEANVIAHGGNPGLAGANLYGKKTPDGYPLFKEMADMIGGGDQSRTFNYSWPKAGSEIPVEKISVAKTFSEWDWVFGTGVYIDDVNNDFKEIVTFSLFILLGSVVLLVCINVPVIRSITKPLNHIKDVMNKVQSGDLTVRTDIKTKNETGELSSSIDMTIQSFQELIALVSKSSMQVVESASALLENAQKASDSSEMQAKETETLSAAMNEMTATVGEVSQNASETYNAIEKVNEAANSGNADMVAITRTIKELSEKMSDSSGIISELDSDTKKVVSVLSNIYDISEQTNLLALNAAIEAARAGESGRGFAVVADEVRRLAQRTQESTKEITEINERLVLAAEKAVRAMGESIKSAQDGAESAEKTGEKFYSIVAQVNDIRGLATQVATATEQQSNVSEEMDQNLNKIAESSQENLSTSASVSESSKTLSDLSNELEGLIKRFQF